MLTVDKMISRVRTMCHDTEEIEYTDVFILDCLNDAVRILRRTAMAVNPETILATLSGDTANDETSATYNGIVKFEHPIGQLVQVTVNGKVIEGISLEAIYDSEEIGQPKFYRMIGFGAMQLFPAPDKVYSYTVTYVDDMSELEIDGSSPFPKILDDLLIEYCGLRVSMTNEFDVQQEQQILGTFVSQIENVLRSIVPQDIQIAGYWDKPYRRRRYGG